MCNRGENAEFITVRIEGKYNGLRIVLVYGSQEKDTEETREAFYEDLSVEIERCLLSGDSQDTEETREALYEDLSVEIERCLLSGDSLLLAGDFNAK